MAGEKKKETKRPKSPTQEMLSEDQESKKPRTKEMVIQALTEMKSRKGMSLYAIKKYIGEKFYVDVEKLNYLIKKSLKDGVEEGSIVQTKGMGASGSFRLAAQAKLQKKTVKKSEKSKQNPTKAKKEQKEKKEKKVENKTDKEKNKTIKEIDSKKEMNKNETGKEKKSKKATTFAKGVQTPAKKKAAMMRRKSNGSIIKPPRMKPK